MNNTFTSTDFDFTPYTITFTIQQTDNPNVNLTKEITIIQYPAIYVEVEPNTDEINGGTDNGDNGFVWVNGYQGSSAQSGTDFFAVANGIAMNNDPNMFVFTVTTTEGTNYVIGDPREQDYTYRADDARWSVSPAIYDGATNRELNYYYGTEVANPKYKNATAQTGVIYANDAEANAAEPTINMIAPKFRLASGYATISDTGEVTRTLENLKKRCASYQEDGYPAGRWRLPTKAEFEFVLTQINLNNLPGVYYKNFDYWCAHGVGTPQTNGTVRMEYVGYDSTGHPVRCVYDVVLGE